MSSRINVGIVGATGYTGAELARILLRHPDVTLGGISSETYAGQSFSAVHPSFKNICELALVNAEQLLGDDDIEVLFLALPHGVSMDFVREVYGTNKKIIDLSADFRLDEKALYDAWYPKPHEFPEGLDGSVYGLPELFADGIQSASLIGNPGCYPTASILGIAPAVRAGIVEPDIIVDAKSGVTGAGVKPKSSTHFSTVNDDFKAYGLPRHRHTVEIEQALDKLNGKDHRVQFTPHLLPVDRGILATIYCRPVEPIPE
ncbi:MAG: N-acetyl-gamma-glutamyl-phosphate reductase, partial [Rubricoccaceae bacterium]|nr:N-acetyl-gamma-glutamyl-phosphate reductase [Rubricoccaceae bacterium]